MNEAPRITCRPDIRHGVVTHPKEPRWHWLATASIGIMIGCFFAGAV